MRAYRGFHDGRDRAVVEVADDPGGPWRPLVHHAKHSPAGFEWGYFGSGPADLARSLLIDHLGEDAWCSSCQAGQRSRPNLGAAFTCAACWGEATTFGPSVYQALKFGLVSNFADAWDLSGAQLEAFLMAHHWSLAGDERIGWAR